MPFKRLLSKIETGGGGLFQSDFLLTWEKDRAALEQILRVARALRLLYRENLATRCFQSGLAVSIFRDHSTRTRFSFASAASLLGLAVQELDEEKSQTAHGETVRETANMISFLTEVIGIRDDLYLGAGHAYMKEVGAALDQGHRAGVLLQRPAVVNLQCDVDHPTQSMADLLHLRDHFGSLAALRGRKLAISWAYSPSYGKPLSVPQGIIGLMTRFGMEVFLAHPPGYHLLPEVIDTARRNADGASGRFEVVDSMEAAFEGADIVYPKSWAPYAVMEQRTRLLQNGDREGLRRLEKEGLAQNARHTDWECSERKMRLTRGGEALYLHCLPADISGVSCAQGEVADTVFDRYRTATYREAGCKPFVIAAVMLAARFEHPAEVLHALHRKAQPRVGVA
jgi:knotted carbamoyltransferase YgeW